MVATCKPPALSASSGMVRVSQVGHPNYTIPKAISHKAINTETTIRLSLNNTMAATRIPITNGGKPVTVLVSFQAGTC